MQHQINLETQKIMKNFSQTCFMSFSTSKHPPHKNDLKECPNYSKFTLTHGPNQQCFRCKAFIGYTNRQLHSKYCLGAKHHIILSSAIQQCLKCGLENDACPTHPPPSSSSSSTCSISSSQYFINLKRDIHEVILLSAIAYSSSLTVVATTEILSSSSSSSSSSSKSLFKPINCCNSSSTISQKLLSNDVMLKEQIYSLFHTPATPAILLSVPNSSSSNNTTQLDTYILLHKSDFSLLALHNWEDIKEKVYKNRTLF